MNYKYHLMINREDSQIVVTEQEHANIQKVIDAGGGLVRVRDRGFHTTSVKAFTPTGEHISAEQELLALKGQVEQPVNSASRKESLKKLQGWVKKQDWFKVKN